MAVDMWSLLVLLPWIVLLVFRGRFWLAAPRLPWRPPLDQWPRVAVVIPARDEAETITQVVAAHRATRYPGPVSVVVVDDASSDGTGGLARDAGAKVVQNPPLPEGWSGKMWAVHNGLRTALTDPDVRWVLLTDADILHAPETLPRLVATAEADDLALVSLMAKLDARGFWGALLIPTFVFFFQKLYPFPWVNRPGHRCAAAAGGCMLVRREVLDQIGGVEGIRNALIDDCALAEKIKHDPTERPIWLGLAEDEVVSLRDNRRLASVWTMVTRTAFTQLQHSVWFLLGSVLGMGLVYLAPVGLCIAGVLGAPDIYLLSGGLAWAAMVLSYTPTLRLYGFGFWRGLALPFAALLYTLMTIHSAIRHWRGKGGFWKGRTYS